MALSFKKHRFYFSRNQKRLLRMKESLSSNQITVNRHQRTVHENEKPFKCEIFQKSFGGKSHLNSHQRTVHENNKQ